MAPLYLLGQDHQHDIQHDFLVMVIALALSSASFEAMVSSMAQLHLFCQDNQYEVQHDFFGNVMHMVLELVSCDADGIVNGMTAFVRS